VRTMVLICAGLRMFAAPLGFEEAGRGRGVERPLCDAEAGAGRQVRRESGEEPG
jgi:hypothetical protein